MPRRSGTTLAQYLFPALSVTVSEICTVFWEARKCCEANRWQVPLDELLTLLFGGTEKKVYICNKACPKNPMHVCVCVVVCAQGRRHSRWSHIDTRVAAVVLLHRSYFDIWSHQPHPNLILHSILISFNEILKALIFLTSGGRRDKEDIELKMERNQQRIKAKGTFNTRWSRRKRREREEKNLTITANCSHYCSHSLHQYCDSYGGVIRVCHRHTNYFSNGCY